MALSRLIMQGVSSRYSSCNLVKSCQQVLSASTFTFKNVEANKTKPLSGEDFMDKNRRLNRPVSPHLGIYKFESNMVMSISHRITGFAQNALLYGLGIGAVALPGSFPYYLGMVEAAHFNPAIILATKFLIAFPFSYHLVNGMRHLIWDCGYLFTIKNVHVTGYLVAGIALLLAAALVNL